MKFIYSNSESLCIQRDYRLALFLFLVTLSNIPSNTYATQPAEVTETKKLIHVLEAEKDSARKLNNEFCADCATDKKADPKALAKSQSDWRELVTDLKNEGICSLQTAGYIYCLDLMNQSLSDPRTYDPAHQLSKLALFTGITFVPRAAKKIWDYRNKWKDKEEEKRDLEEVLSAAKSHLSENSHNYTDEQRKAYQKIIEQSEKILRNFAHEKLKEGHSTLSMMTGNQGLTLNSMVTAAESIKPSEADLRHPKNEHLKAAFDQLSAVMELPVHAKKFNQNKIVHDCEEALKSRPEAFRTKLTAIASGLAASSNEAQSNRQFHFFYGEPGNGKTTGIQDMAKCVGAPICIITADQIRRKIHATDFTKQPQMSMMGMEGAQRSVGVADAMEEEVARCLKDEFRDENGKPITNGIVLFDDIDRILATELRKSDSKSMQEQMEDQMSNPMMMGGMGGGMMMMNGNGGIGMTKPKPKPVDSTERRRVFDLLKQLSDPAQATILDKASGFPINMTRTTFFATANSVPIEIQKTDSALISRMHKFSVPYPLEKERKAIAQQRFEAFKKRLHANGLKDLNDAHCQVKINEILQYDANKLKEMGGQFGVRGLIGLLDDYFSEISTRASSHPHSDVCSQHVFNVTAHGLSKGDYNRSVSEELEEELFERNLLEFSQDVGEQLSKMPNQEIAKNLALNISGLRNEFVAQPLISKKRLFEDLKNAVKFNLDRLKFPEAKGELAARLNEKFSYLKNTKQGDADRLTPLFKVANSIARKLHTGGPNRVVIVEKEDENGDLGSIKALADTYGLPLIEIEEKKIFEKHTVLIESTKKNRTQKTRNHHQKDNDQNDDDENDDGRNEDRNEDIKMDQKNRAVDSSPDNWGLWADKALDLLKNKEYSGQSFVVLHVPKLGNSELKDFTQEVSTRINNEEDKNGLIDLSKITVFVVPKNGDTARSVSQSTLKDKVETLRVGALPPAGRKALAHNLLKEGLSSLKEELGAETDLKLTERDVETMNRIIDFDFKEAEKHHGSFSVEPLRASVGELLNEVRARHDDFLGLLSQEKNSQEWTDLDRRLNLIYEDHAKEKKEPTLPVAPILPASLEKVEIKAPDLK